jgi:trans-aconitate methyltransferase
MPSFAKIKAGLIQRLVRDPTGKGRPVPKEAFDEEYRSGHWDHFDSPEETPRNLVVAGLVAQKFRLPSILDIGCGAGRLAQIYQVYPFARYNGVDVSAEGLRKARSLGLDRVEFFEGNFEIWRPAVSYDAIIFNESIGYAIDPAETLRIFSAHLLPGGAFFLSHFQSGNHRAVLRRIERACDVLFATSVTSDRGKVWDIKILGPHRASPS